MSGIHPEAGYLGQPLNRILLLTQQICDLVIQLVHLSFDQLQLLQRHLDESSIDAVQFGRSPECIA